MVAKNSRPRRNDFIHFFDRQFLGATSREINFLSTGHVRWPAATVCIYELGHIFEKVSLSNSEF